MIRVLVMLCALAVTVFQLMTDAWAAPPTVPSLPWLDGRPTVIHVVQAPAWLPGSDGPLRFVRFRTTDRARLGLLDGEAILELRGDLFSGPAPTGRVLRRSEVTLLSPLSAEDVGTVRLIDPAMSPPSATPPMELGEGCPYGPGDNLEIQQRGSCTVLSVLALVAGRRSKLLGVTGGTLARVADGPWLLALGPSLVQGADLEARHGVPRHVAVAAASMMKEDQYQAGDLLLIAQHGPSETPETGIGEWVTSAIGVGVLRNRVSVQQSVGDA